MARESLQDRQARLAKIIAGLQRAYPDAHCELNFTNPRELLVATILSAQCTDKRVNLVTADLFRTYRAAADYAGADSAALEQALKSTGLSGHKARKIQACFCDLGGRHAGQ